MLSRRGDKLAASQDIPWRFAPGGNNRYDAVSNPSGVISLATAENTLVHEELRQFVRKVDIPGDAFTYGYSTTGGPRFPVAMAAHMNEHFHPFTPVEPAHILTGASLTSIHHLVGLSIGDPGDGILVSRPIYGRFELDFGNVAGLKIVYADMHGVDPFSPDTVAKYQDALDSALSKGVSIKALMIINPHNPLGRCYPQKTLENLMAFCGKNSIHLISDEVYALSVYKNASAPSAPPFTSVLAVNPSGLLPPEHVQVFYGMSKDFAAPGLRLGSLISQNIPLRKAVAANMRFHGPSGASIAICTAILEDREFVADFIGLCRERLSDARAYAVAVLEKAGVEIHPGGNAGFFLYINLSPWLRAGMDPPAQEFELAQRLLDAGVGLHPREEHGEEIGWFRVVFSIKREILAEALTRMISTLGTVS